MASPKLVACGGGAVFISGLLGLRSYGSLKERYDSLEKSYESMKNTYKTIKGGLEQAQGAYDQKLKPTVDFLSNKKNQFYLKWSIYGAVAIVGVWGTYSFLKDVFIKKSEVKERKFLSIVEVEGNRDRFFVHVVEEITVIEEKDEKLAQLQRDFFTELFN